MSTEKAQLEEYNVQLQQVEAALTIDPDNEDLQKLKKDLLEVIELTTELIEAAEPSKSSAKHSDGAESSHASEESQYFTASTTDGSTSNSDAAAPDESAHVLPPVIRSVRSGAKCLAPWSKDSQYYPAIIKDVISDTTCTVTFLGYNQTEEKMTTDVRDYDANYKRPGSGDGGQAAKKAKRDLAAKEREYKKAKNLKKQQRRKEIDELTEREKNKWKDFNAKAFAKSSKGRVRKSIFATPDTVQGKVGIGTCGKAGRPMTKFSHTQALAKWSATKK